MRGGGGGGARSSLYLAEQYRVKKQLALDSA